jgi:hypothetical protein
VWPAIKSRSHQEVVGMDLVVVVVVVAVRLRRLHIASAGC